KPHDKSMSLGALATHIAEISTWADAILGQLSFDMADAPARANAGTSRADILKRFDESSAAARRAMDRSDAEYAAMWTLKRTAHEIFSMPRTAVFRSFVLSHLIHHRG